MYFGLPFSANRTRYIKENSMVKSIFCFAEPKQPFVYGFLEPWIGNLIIYNCENYGSFFSFRLRKGRIVLAHNNI